MLSLDRKRKDTPRRPRNRLNPPTLEFIPCSAPVEQLPFPEQHYFGMAASNESRFSGNEQQVSSLYRSPVNVPLQPTISVMPTPTLHPLFAPGSSPVRETGELLNPLRLTAQQRLYWDGQHTEQVSAMSTSTLIQLRNAVVIPGQAKNVTRNTGRMESLSPDKQVSTGRRVVVSLATCFLVLFVLLSTFLIVVPTGGNGTIFAVDALRSEISQISLHKDNIALISSQRATVTAVTQDGYDPGDIHVAGLPSAPASLRNSSVNSARLNRFFYGQCTYWANMRYYQLTGHWIPWLGNAYQWAYEAPAYGWTISDTPNPRGASIMVFSPYAEGSGAYGHVAVVERVNTDGSVYTSNWNWNGAWGRQSWLTFYPTNGVSFIWYPQQ